MGRSAGERIGYPLQYSGLESSMDCTVHRVAPSHVIMSKALARLIKIRLPGVECSICQINASHKILLCIFEKYGIQFIYKKTNYIILLGSSEQVLSSVQFNHSVVSNSL